MLSIDHQDGRFSCNESGADPGIGGCQQRDAICRAAAAGGIRVGGADTGSAPVRRPAEARQGRSPTLSGADDRFETSSGDAPDHRVSADRSSDRSALPTGTFSQHLHRSRCGIVVLRGPGARELERTSHATNPEYSEYGQAAYQRLAGISVAHLYRLRATQAYRKRNTTYQPTRPTPIPIGERRKPQPQGKPGYLRVDTVHQGDRDGNKGLYHINAV